MKRSKRTINVYVGIIVIVGIILMIAGVATASTAGVTQAQYDAVQGGWSKHHVEQTFDDSGYRVPGGWTGGRGWHHIHKFYRAETGEWVHIYYRQSPYGHHWHVQLHNGKTLCPTEAPCS